MLGLAWFRAIDAELEAMRVHCRDCHVLWIRASRELHNDYIRAFFAARKAEVVNGGYRFLHWFADYSCPLEVEASENDFLHTPSSLPEKTLEQLQTFIQGTFQKDRAASNAMEKRIWSPNMNEGDGRIDKKDHQEGRMKYKFPFYLLMGYMEEKENVCTARQLAALHLSLGWLSISMDLNDSFQYPMYTLDSVGR